MASLTPEVFVDELQQTVRLALAPSAPRASAAGRRHAHNRSSLRRKRL
jgi:hypothetical protein